MTIETSTPAQRQDLRDKLFIAAHAAQRFAQNSAAPTVGQAAIFDPKMLAADAAIVAAGYSPSLPATQAIVANGGSVPVKNVAGVAVPGSSVATVAGGVLSAVNLPTNVAPVVSGVKVNAVSVTGTGNFATITVTAGVISAIVLSAS